MDYSGNFTYNGYGPQIPHPHPTQSTIYSTSFSQREPPLSQSLLYPSQFSQAEVSQSQRSTPYENTIPNVQVKPQLLARAKGKERAKEKSQGGHHQEVANFTEDATIELLKIIENLLPIGADGWLAVQNEFNTYARSNGLPERESRSLRLKFDKLVNTAMEKPTGEANQSQLLKTALKIYGDLTAKSGTATLDDDLLKQENEAGVVSVERHKVIHLTATSDGDSTGEGHSKNPKAVKSNLVVKGYRTANPLEIKSHKTHASTSQATDAMASIGTYFSDDHVCERTDAQTTTSVHLLQLQSVMTELREIRSWNEQISDSLRAETCRTDKLDIQNSNLKDKIEELKAKNRGLKDDLHYMQPRHHHRRPLKSDSESDSSASPHERSHCHHHHHRHCRRQQYTPSPRRSAATVPPVQAETPQNSPDMHELSNPQHPKVS
ncbi:hypothetical protein BJY52DRAFT_1196185 [Lactarius psammicola]|nr:hypothetical protein BJY52DRAFT_1196185 [Lactarius psammicola]